MKGKYKYIKFFEELGISDVSLVGGKTASLGEMYQELTRQGVKVPNGFGITAEAYRYMLDEANAWEGLHRALDGIDPDDVADLAELVNEAAILAVRRNKRTIGMDELEDSIDRVLAGPERKSLKVKPKDKELTAYHEAGHALVARLLPNVDPVHKISIVARSSMGGYTRLLEEDRYFMTESQFKDTLATFLAGHAAEQMIFNEVSTGPHSDMRQATDIARKMVTDYGMSEKLGLRTYGQLTVPGYLGIGPSEQRDYSEEVAKQIDEEVHRILAEAHQVAKKLLEENRPRLAHLAEKLLVKETLEGPELEAAFTEPISEVDDREERGSWKMAVPQSEKNRNS